jgi:hypothetical protein
VCCGLRAQEGIAVAIASPDKDFFQLLRPGLILLRPPKKPAPGERGPPNKNALVPYSQADFEREYGLHPSLFVDVLALAGDASGAAAAGWLPSSLVCRQRRGYAGWRGLRLGCQAEQWLVGL